MSTINWIEVKLIRNLRPFHPLFSCTVAALPSAISNVSTYQTFRLSLLLMFNILITYIFIFASNISNSTFMRVLTYLF